MNAGLIVGGRGGRETRQCSVLHTIKPVEYRSGRILSWSHEAQKSSPQNRLEARSKRCLLDPSREGPAMNQLLSQIQTLQEKVNALNAQKEFYDLETASSSGMSHVPLRIPSPRGMLSRDSGLPHHTRNSMGTSPERLSPSFPGVAMRHGEGLRREPQSSTVPTPRFSRNPNTWNSTHPTGNSEVCFLGIAFLEPR